MRQVLRAFGSSFRCIRQELSFKEGIAFFSLTISTWLFNISLILDHYYSIPPALIFCYNLFHAKESPHFDTIVVSRSVSRDIVLILIFFTYVLITRLDCIQK